MSINLIAFALEIVASLCISAFVLYLLQPVLVELLRELCLRDTRAALWGAFTRLMIFISPLIIVIFFTKNTGIGPIELVQTVRAILLHALFGQFIGLVVIGIVVLNFSRHDALARAAMPVGGVDEDRGPAARPA